jgi:general secretion pathway protein B
MSLILEALKKAQRDRARHQAPEAMLSPYATARKSRPMASWAVIAGAVLLFASGGVVTWWWGRAADPFPAPASPVEISRPAPAPEISEQAPKPALVPPGPSPATPAREAGGQLAPPSIRPMPPAKPRPSGPSGTGDVAGPPAASASVRRPPAAAPSAALVPPPRASATPASVQSAPAPLATAVPVPRASPSLAEVIPTLTLNAHIYSEVKEERIVYIDGRRYVEGERVNELYLLEAITPQGVLLSYQGERGLLSTPLGRVAR